MDGEGNIKYETLVYALVPRMTDGSAQQSTMICF